MASSRMRPPRENAISPEEVARCLEILEAVIEDRTAISDVPDELRIAFLVAAGRVSRPTRDESRKSAKAFRRIVRGKKQDHDRDVRATTETRAARRNEVFSAPAQLVGGTEPAGEERELIRPRAC